MGARWKLDVRMPVPHADALRGTETEGRKREERKGETAEQLKWEKTPSSVGEPSSSSGTASMGAASSNERGMAVAAFPPPGKVAEPDGKPEDKTTKTMLPPGKKRIDYRDRILVVMWRRMIDWVIYLTR